MVRQSWRTQLKSAADERDVLAIVRTFLGEWSKAEIDALPCGAWPSRIGNRADLLSHSVVLAGLHARFRGPGTALPGLQELLLFFTHAAVRIAKIEAAAQGADCPPRRAPPRRKGRLGGAQRAPPRERSRSGPGG